MSENEKDQKQYVMDSILALTERTIKRLWILVVLLIVLLFGSNAAWIHYESQFEDVVVTQEVEQDAENGENHFVGGDFYGEATNKDDAQNTNP